MLFMPTNVTPSATGGLGCGTVDAAEDLTVSWQVNGNSAMTAYRIVIYLNDASSTQKYTTGKLTANCPFYGTDYQGNLQFFSHTIAASALALAGISNGNEYKLLITQWWGAADAESVTQQSAAAFATRLTPTVTLTAVPNPLAKREYSFAATYAQAQGDALNWVRWELAEADNTDNPIYDTGNLYGTAQLRMDYDGMFSGTSYAVKCSIQTQNGVEADTGWNEFLVQYETMSMSGYVRATRDCNGKNAVKVDWSGIGYINGHGGGYTIDTGNVLHLNVGGVVYWNEINGRPLSFGAPWSMVWSGKMDYADATLFQINTEEGTVKLRYVLAERTLKLTWNDTQIGSWNHIRYDADINAVLTPTTLYLRKVMASGGLYPSASLYPTGSLYPEMDDEVTTLTVQIPVTYTQGSILEVYMRGKLLCNYMQALCGAASQSVITDVITDGDYVPSYDARTYMMVNFEDGLNAGNLMLDGENMDGFAIYRLDEPGAALVHIADMPVTVDIIYDYGVVNQDAPYTYYLFPLGTDTYLTEPILSNIVQPKWWDWTLLDCEEQTDGSYSVKQQFTFRSNIVSGTIANNNAPGILTNFTRYPIVQTAPQNFQSGVLQGLIGDVGMTDGVWRYRDTLEQRNALLALSNTKDTLFLKSRKGDIFRVKVNGSVQYATADNLAEQAQTVLLPWCEVGSADNVHIYTLS